MGEPWVYSSDEEFIAKPNYLYKARRYESDDDEKEYQLSLVDDMQKFMEENTEKFSDISIKCEDGDIIKTFKFLLLARSEYFKRSIKSDTKLIETTFEYFAARAAIDSLLNFDIRKMESLEFCKINNVTKYLKFKPRRYNELAMRDLQRFFEKKDSEFADCSITCSDGKTIKTFRVLLMAKSKYFKSLFDLEPEKKEVELSQFDSKIIQVTVDALLKFKVNDMDLDTAGFMKLFEVSDYLQIESLLEEVGNFLVNHNLDELDKENVLAIYRAADKTGKERVKSECAKYIKLHMPGHKLD